MKSIYKFTIGAVLGLGILIACDADVEIDQTVEEIQSAQPTITNISPATAPVNSTVTVEGTFLNFAEQAFVGDTEAQIISRITGERLEIRVPNNASSGTVRIVTEQEKEAVSQDQLNVTYPAPTVTEDLPENGEVNAILNIIGTNLGSVTGVQFGGVDGTIEFQENQALAVTIPNNAGVVDIVLTYLSENGEVTLSINDNFEIIIPQPTLGGFPSVLTRDREVVVLGDDINLITDGDVDGVPITINSQTANEIRFDVPGSIETGFVDITFNFQGDGVLMQDDIPYINGQFEQYLEFDSDPLSVFTVSNSSDPGATQQINGEVDQPPFPGEQYYNLTMTTATGSTIGRCSVDEVTTNPSFNEILDPGNYGGNPVLHFWLNSQNTEPVFVLYLGGTSNDFRRRWQNGTTNFGDDWQLVAIRLNDFIPGQTAVNNEFDLRITTGSNTATLPVKVNFDWFIVTDSVLTEFGAVDVTDEFDAAG